LVSTRMGSSPLSRQLCPIWVCLRFPVVMRSGFSRALVSISYLPPSQPLAWECLPSTPDSRLGETMRLAVNPPGGGRGNRRGAHQSSGWRRRTPVTPYASWLRAILSWQFATRLGWCRFFRTKLPRIFRFPPPLSVRSSSCELSCRSLLTTMGAASWDAWVNLSPSVYLTHSANSGTGQITWKQLRLDYSLAGEGAQGAKGDAGPAGANGANGADGAPGGAPVRPPVTDCSIAWNLTGSAPYPQWGNGRSARAAAYSNAVISSRQGIFGKTAALQTLSTDSKGLLRTVATAVGESPEHNRCLLGKGTTAKGLFRTVR